MSWRGRDGWPPFDHVVVQLCEAYPRGHVGFVVERGNDEFGAGGEIEDEREVGEELSC